MRFRGSIYNSSDLNSKFNAFVETFINNFVPSFLIKCDRISKRRNDCYEGNKITYFYVHSGNSRDPETKVFVGNIVKLNNKSYKRDEKQHYIRLTANSKN
jgi:hypothetical protein